MKKNIFKKYPTFFVFSAIVILFTVIDIINSPKEFSELENRNLSQIPILSLESYIDTSFSSDYEKYINDQFFLRDKWIDLKSRIEYLLGKRENNDIIFGKDNYLFKKFTTFNGEMLENNINSILTFTNSYKTDVDFFKLCGQYWDRGCDQRFVGKEFFDFGRCIVYPCQPGIVVFCICHIPFIFYEEDLKWKKK